MKKLCTDDTIKRVCALSVLTIAACSERSDLPPPQAADQTSAPLTLETTEINLPATSITNIADPGNPMDHSHMPVAVPEGGPTPRLSVALSRDWMTGLNLEIQTDCYTLIPPPSGLRMNQLMAPSIDAATGFVEGHAHLYVNGEKRQRIYGHAAHLPANLFKPGVNQVTVSINNHGHMYWASDQRQILATLFIDLEKDALILHRFESFPVTETASGKDCKA